MVVAQVFRGRQSSESTERVSGQFQDFYTKKPCLENPNQNKTNRNNHLQRWVTERRSERQVLLDMFIKERLIYNLCIAPFIFT